MVTGQFTGKSCLVGAAAGRDNPNQFTGRYSPKSLTVHIQHWKMEEILYGPTVAGSQLTELGGGGREGDGGGLRTVTE